MSNFTFIVAAGKLTGPNGLTMDAWSGHNTLLVKGLNNPAAFACKGVGPLPAGLYAVGAMEASHGPLGPFVMALTPSDGHMTYGRGSFYIHGAAAVHPELSSDGCIIIPRAQRQQLDRLMTQLGDRQLLVIPDDLPLVTLK